MKEYKRVTIDKPRKNLNPKEGWSYSHIYKRLQELEDKIENGTLVELEKPYIKQQSNGLYIVCIAQEVGVTMAVKTKDQAEQKLKEQQNEN